MGCTTSNRSNSFGVDPAQRAERFLQICFQVRFANNNYIHRYPRPETKSACTSGEMARLLWFKPHITADRVANSQLILIACLYFNLNIKQGFDQTSQRLYLRSIIVQCSSSNNLFISPEMTIKKKSHHTETLYDRPYGRFRADLTITWDSMSVCLGKVRDTIQAFCFVLFCFYLLLIGYNLC